MFPLVFHLYFDRRSSRAIFSNFKMYSVYCFCISYPAKKEIIDIDVICSFRLKLQIWTILPGLTVHSLTQMFGIYAD